MPHRLDFLEKRTSRTDRGGRRLSVPESDAVVPARASPAPCITSEAIVTEELPDATAVLKHVTVVSHWPGPDALRYIGAI